jgi:hypothetical protein
VSKPDEFLAVFAQLKGIIEPHVDGLVVTVDTSDNYALDAPPSAAQPTGQFFGGVQIKKNYVSYHLMPVYVYPNLLDGLPDRLRRRMQGKSCFNFTALDAETVADLARLTEAGYERFRQAGAIPGSGPSG